jgi:hypothetical protein
VEVAGVLAEREFIVGHATVAQQCHPARLAGHPTSRARRTFMSNYGPPGGPYPGRPQEPWTGQPANDPYGQPSDPWGGQDPWGGAPSNPPGGPGSPAGYAQGYGGYPDPGYAGYGSDQHYGPGHQPVGGEPTWVAPAPPKKASRAPIIALVVALAVLVLGGGATTIYLLSQDKATPTTSSTGQPTDGPSGQSDQTSEPEATTPGPESSTDARFVKAGQCVKNEGTAAKPKLVITKCGSKTYEVLARFDGATSGQDDAKTKCGKVPDYTDWYFFNSDLDALDFVLCLKLR